MARPRIEINMKEVRKFIQEGNSIAHIAEVLECSKSLLIKRCAEAGIALPRMRSVLSPANAHEVEQAEVKAVKAAQQQLEPKLDDLLQRARDELPRLRDARETAYLRLAELDRTIAGYQKFVQSFQEPPV